MNAASCQRSGVPNKMRRHGYPLDKNAFKPPKPVPIGPYRVEHIEKMLELLDRDWRVASWPKRPTKWVPTGGPSPFQKSGTDRTGCPVMLQVIVKGIKADRVRLDRRLLPTRHSPQRDTSFCQPCILFGQLQSLLLKERLNTPLPQKSLSKQTPCHARN